MNIEILTYLRDNPIKKSFQIQGISIFEIEYLQVLFNNSNNFPKALKELLFLAGEYCHVLDYGLFDTQEEMQIAARSWLTRYGIKIIRPFYVIDVYNAGEQFLYIYLDEGNDPFIYQAYLPERNDIDTLTSLNKKLSEYINDGINQVKQGINPF